MLVPHPHTRPLLTVLLIGHCRCVAVVADPVRAPDKCAASATSCGLALLQWSTRTGSTASAAGESVSHAGVDAAGQHVYSMAKREGIGSDGKGEGASGINVSSLAISLLNRSSAEAFTSKAYVLTGRVANTSTSRGAVLFQESQDPATALLVLGHPGLIVLAVACLILMFLLWGGTLQQLEDRPIGSVVDTANQFVADPAGSVHRTEEALENVRWPSPRRVNNREFGCC
mmetsp:Transcript_101939/g.287712  ORF Transcript_101939/g.287712 Transcript_101939/m.287712 type:complete len:229 (-) Transcript_101939:24-710(-)